MPWHESIIEAELAKTKVLVNATSIGLHGDVSPIPAEILTPDLLVLDLIYSEDPAAARGGGGRLHHGRRRADAAPPGRRGVHALDRPAGAARGDGRGAGRRTGEGPAVRRGRAGGRRRRRRRRARRGLTATRASSDMDRFRFITAGESHGPTLGAVVEGVPAGLALTEDDLAVDLARRQRGYGRGARQSIEQDRARILARRAARPDAGLADPARGRQPRLGELDPGHAGRAAVRRGGGRAGGPRRRRQQARPADHPRPAWPRRPRRAR